MAIDVRVLQIVVASPNDVKAERDAVDKVIKELNNWVTKDYGFLLNISRWEDDAYAGFHVDGPQGLIDPILNIKRRYIHWHILEEVRHACKRRQIRYRTRIQDRIGIVAKEPKPSDNVFFQPEIPYATDKRGNRSVGSGARIQEQFSWTLVVI